MDQFSGSEGKHIVRQVGIFFGMLRGLPYLGFVRSYLEQPVNNYHYVWTRPLLTIIIHCYR